MQVRAYIVCSLLVLPLPGLAETIRLTTGEVLIGEVTNANFERIQLAMVFPHKRHVILEASQLDPSSYYEVLSQRLDPRDLDSRLRILEFCLDRGLFAQAVVEAEAAVKLNASLQVRLRDLRKKAVEAVANSLLDQAKTYLAVGQPREARLYLRSIIDRYSEAKSARIAKTLLRRLKSRRSKEDEDAGPIRDPREKKKIREKLRQAHNLLTKMDRLIGDLDRPFRPGRAEERALLKSAPYYRKSYALLRKAGKRPTDDETLNLQVRRLAEESRSKLAKLYVAIGRVYLSRGAIRLAEEYSARAYGIDADSESQRELQEKIVDSRILFQ